MNARQKLNSAAVIGAVVGGGLLGWVTGSWFVFVVVVIAIVVMAHEDGTIRLHPDASAWKPAPRRWKRHR